MGGATHTTPSGDRGGRAFWLGRRWAFLTAAIAAVVLAGVVVLALKPSSGGGGTIDVHGRNLPITKKFGHPAKWIKIPKAPVVTVATATPAHPQLRAMEGYPIRAELPAGSAEISVEGPSVPNWVSNEASAGKWPSGTAAPSTFYVTYTAAKGSVPLSSGDFSVVTFNGELMHPKVTLASGGRLPASLPAGKPTTLKLTTSIPEGDGEVRWAPGGKRILVAYFWTLELS